jgi:hypothetical protein
MNSLRIASAVDKELHIYEYMIAREVKDIAMVHVKSLGSRVTQQLFLEEFFRANRMPLGRKVFWHLREDDMALLFGEDCIQKACEFSAIRDAMISGDLPMRMADRRTGQLLGYSESALEKFDAWNYEGGLAEYWSKL